MDPTFALCAVRAGYTLVVKSAARKLYPNGEFTPPPFPFDPDFYSRLRTDQVPRFLGALTDPAKLPLRNLPLGRLVATQNRIDPEKASAMQGGKRPGAPVVAEIDGVFYIIDGHHGATAAWLDGKDEVEVRFKNLSEFSYAMKGRLP